MYTVVIVPHTAPPFTASPHLNTAARIGVFLVIYDSFHRQFPNTAAFSSVPRSAVLGGTTVLYFNQSFEFCLKALNSENSGKNAGA